MNLGCNPDAFDHIRTETATFLESRWWMPFVETGDANFTFVFSPTIGAILVSAKISTALLQIRCNLTTSIRLVVPYK